MSVTKSSSKHSTRVLLRELVGDQFERIGAILVLLQFVVHRLHEAVEVTALLVPERQALEEQIHQPGLAAADAAPHVQSALQAAAVLRDRALSRPRRAAVLGLSRAISCSRSSIGQARRATLCRVGDR